MPFRQFRASTFKSAESTSPSPVKSPRPHDASDCRQFNANAFRSVASTLESKTAIQPNNSVSFGYFCTKVRKPPPLISQVVCTTCVSSITRPPVIDLVQLWDSGGREIDQNLARLV